MLAALAVWLDVRCVQGRQHPAIRDCALAPIGLSYRDSKGSLAQTWCNERRCTRTSLRLRTKPRHLIGGAEPGNVQELFPECKAFCVLRGVQFSSLNAGRR